MLRTVGSARKTWRSFLLRNLRKLSYAGPCPGNSLIALARLFPNVRTLDIRGLSQLSDEAVDEVFEDCCPRLTNVQLRSTDLSILPSHVELLFLNASQLRAFSLRKDVGGLRDRTLKLMSKVCPNLESLEAIVGDKVTNKAIANLWLNLTKLDHLHIKSADLRTSGEEQSGSSVFFWTVQHGHQDTPDHTPTSSPLSSPPPPLLSNITFLKIKNFTLSSGMVVKILEHCPRLQTLYVGFSQSFISFESNAVLGNARSPEGDACPPGASYSLCSLHLNCLPISDTGFTSVLSASPYLTHLTLKNMGSFERLETLASIPQLCSGLRTLKLEICSGSLRPQHPLAITPSFSTSLKRLSFKSTYSIDDTMLCSTIDQLPNLEMLNIRNCHKISRVSTLEHVVACCPRLSALKASFCKFRVADVVRPPGTLQNLNVSKLCLRSSHSASPSVLSNILAMLPRIRDLSLSGNEQENCDEEYDTAMLRVMAMPKDLERLSLLSFQDVSFLTNTARTLQTLDLDDCEISFPSFGQVLGHLTNLTRLRLTDCIGPDGSPCGSDWTGHFPQLRKLQLVSGTVAFPNVLACTPSLTSLHLDSAGSPPFSAACAGNSIARHLSHLHSLKMLSIRHLPRNVDVLALAAACPSLRLLVCSPTVFPDTLTFGTSFPGVVVHFSTGDTIIVPLPADKKVRDLAVIARERFKRLSDQPSPDLSLFVSGGLLDSEDACDDVLRDDDKIVAVRKGESLQMAAPSSPSSSSVPNAPKPKPKPPTKFQRLIGRLAKIPFRAIWTLLSILGLAVVAYTLQIKITDFDLRLLLSGLILISLSRSVSRFSIFHVFTGFGLGGALAIALIFIFILNRTGKGFIAIITPILAVAAAGRRMVLEYARHLWTLIPWYYWAGVLGAFAISGAIYVYWKGTFSTPKSQNVLVFVLRDLFGAGLVILSALPPFDPNAMLWHGIPVALLSLGALPVENLAALSRLVLRRPTAPVDESQHEHTD